MTPAVIKTQTLAVAFSVVDFSAEQTKMLRSTTSTVLSFFLTLHSQKKKNNSYTAEAKFGFSERGAASHQAEDEHHHADADDDGGWD